MYYSTIARNTLLGVPQGVAVVSTALCLSGSTQRAMVHYNETTGERVMYPVMCASHASRDILQIQPWMDEWEQNWPRFIRVCWYFLQILWAFLGVSIIADIFMGAIEEITLKTYVKIDKKTGKKKLCRVWCVLTSAAAKLSTADWSHAACCKDSIPCGST